MKKKITGYRCVGIVYKRRNAQDARFGVKAGVNIFSLRGDIEDVSSVTGMHAGVVAEFKLSESVAIQPELLFSMQGGKTETSSTQRNFGVVEYYSDKTEIRLNYITLPVMAKFYIVDKFSIEAGPQFGILVSARGEVESSYTSGSVTYTESGGGDIKELFQTVDTALNLGIAYDTAFGLFFQARYSLGVANIIDIDGSTNNVNNSGFQISAGYKF